MLDYETNFDKDEWSEYVVQLAINKNIFWQTLAEYDKAVDRLEKEIEKYLSHSKLTEPAYQLLSNTLELLQSEV